MNTEIDDSVREAARNWYILASAGEVKAEDVFFRFVAAYIAFIAILTNKYSNKDRGREVEDWQRIKWFSEDTGDRHAKLLNSTEYREAVEQLADRPIHNMQTNRPNRRVREIKNLKDSPYARTRFNTG